MTRGTSKRGNLLLVSISILIAICVAELACRIALAPPGFSPLSGDYVPGLFVEHPIRGYTYTDRFVGRQTSPDYDVTFNVNDLGLREKPLGLPTGSEQRILVVGDSFATGLGVSYEEALPNQLEQVLHESGGNGEIRVINAGIDGYSVRQIRQLAEELLPVLRPDLLVVGVYVAAHDRVSNPFVLVGDYIVRNHMVDRVEFGDGGYYYSDYDRPWAVAVDLWLSKNFFFGARVFRSPSVIRPRFNRLIRKPLAAEAMKVQLEPLLQELALLKQLTDARDLPIVVLLIAGQRADRSFRADNSLKHTIVRDFCIEQDIPAVDTLPALVAAAHDGEYLRFPGDGHWNARAHRIAAELLAESSTLQTFGLQHQ